MSIVTPGEGRLRGFIRALTSLKESVKAALDQDSHLSLYDAIQHSKCVEPDLYEQLDSLPTGLADSLKTAMAKVVGRKSVQVEELNSVLDDCYETINRSLDAISGRAPILIPDVPPVKRLKLGPFEAPNIANPPNRSIFVRDSHPFGSVIKKLLFDDPWVIDVWGKTEIEADSTETTPCTYVDTFESLQEMVSDLQKEPVICVDLENHNYYSYHGFTCLLQLSSKSADYLVDAIKLKVELKGELPKIMSNPKILKLLHGAEHDSGWLQRDFDCHLVSVFDTFIAAKKLDIVKKSLNGLLQHYFNISLDKQYQLADWRVRPLPKEMLKYARLDTHYLIPLWERLKKAVIEVVGVEGLLKVYEESSLQCLKLYRPENEDLGKWKTLVSKSSVILDDIQQAIVKTVYEWRDRTAREHDVCHHAILANHWVVRLAMSKPMSTEALKRCLRDGFTRFVELHAEELVSTIKQVNLSSVSDIEKTAVKASKASDIEKTAVLAEKAIVEGQSVPSKSSTPSTTITGQSTSRLVKRPISIAAPNASKTSFSGIMDSVERQIDDSVLLIPQMPVVDRRPVPVQEPTQPAPEVVPDKRTRNQEEMAAKVEAIIEAGPITIAAKAAKSRKIMLVDPVDLDSVATDLYGKRDHEKAPKPRFKREKDSLEDKKQKYKKKKSSKGRFVTFSK